MGYLRKVGVLSFWMLTAGILFLLLSIIFYNVSDFRDFVKYGYSEHLFSKLMTIVLFVSSLFLLLLSGTLHLLRIDAEEELDFIEDRTLREVERRYGPGK